MEQIIETGSVTRGWIGVEAQGDHAGDRRLAPPLLDQRRSDRGRASRRPAEKAA